jgi:hypothetical protein
MTDRACRWVVCLALRLEDPDLNWLASWDPQRGLDTVIGVDPGCNVCEQTVWKNHMKATYTGSQLEEGMETALVDMLCISPDRCAPRGIS